MLPAGARLRRRVEFSAAVRGGQRSARGALVVHLHPADPAVPGPTRVGFVVPRTVGGAVVRNKVRRRLRELVRHRLATLPPGAWVVVRALPDAARRDQAGLGADLDAALAAAVRRRRAAPEQA